MRAERLASHLGEPADVDGRSERFRAGQARQPRVVEGRLQAELLELGVDLAEALPRPDRVVELGGGERRSGAREAVRITGGVEGHDGDLVDPEVVRMRVL